MQAQDPPSLLLARGQFWSARLPRGAAIHCASGRLLITLEAVWDDFVLDPGQALYLSRRGKAVVEAIESARVLVRQ